MHIVDRIFEELGETTAIANETGDPVQTVNCWKTNGNIPRWRRASLIEIARRTNKALSDESLEYLASSERAPRKAAA